MGDIDLSELEKYAKDEDLYSTEELIDFLLNVHENIDEYLPDLIDDVVNCTCQPPKWPVAKRTPKQERPNCPNCGEVGGWSKDTKIRSRNSSGNKVEYCCSNCGLEWSQIPPKKLVPNQDPQIRRTNLTKEERVQARLDGKRKAKRNREEGD